VFSMRSFVSVVTSAVVFLFAFSTPALSQEKNTITVSEASLCLDVVDLSCIGENELFPAEAGKIYCHSRIVGARAPVTVTHVWYFGNLEVARVPLSVKSSNWRTYSSKRILPGQIGDWHVDIVGPAGTILKKVAFTVTPQ